MILKTNIKHSLLENIIIIIELEKISMYRTDKKFLFRFYFQKIQFLEGSGFYLCKND